MDQMKVMPSFQKRRRLKGIKKKELTFLIWAMPEDKQSEPWEIYKMIKKELEERNHAACPNQK